MRIVGGGLRGRRLPAPVGKGTRPTSDRVREALASALEARDRLRDAAVLDLFAGTGALAFEALSRGADRATLVERDRRAAAQIRATAQALGLTARVTVVVADLLRPGGRRGLQGPFDLAFADPPYALADALGPLFQQLWEAGHLAPGAVLALEHPRAAEPPFDERFERLASYRYGDTSVTLRRAPEGPAGAGAPQDQEIPE